MIDNCEYIGVVPSLDECLKRLHLEITSLRNSLIADLLK